MTVNPSDYGDPKPSDLDDVPPINRGDLLEEHAYRVSQAGKGETVRPRFPATVNPDAEVEPKKLPPRHSYTAVILERLQRGQYRVFRQDGFVGIAYARGDDTQYDALQVGEYVVLEKSNLPDIYYIIGSQRLNELSTLCLYNTQEIGPTNTERQIFLDAIDLKTGSEIDHFAGGFMALKDQWALYEINYSFSIEQTDDTNNNNVSSISVGEECNIERNLVPLDNPRVFTGLRFDNRSGIRVRQSADDSCNAIVRLEVHAEGMMPQSNVDGTVRWTEGPELGHKLTVGTEGNGWIFIRNAPGELGITSGYRKLRTVYPNNAAFKGAFLRVKSYEPHPDGLECVQFEWVKTGGTGVIQAYNCYNQCVQWIVENGLIISGPGITAQVPTVGAVECTVRNSKTYDCEQHIPDVPQS